MLSQAIDLPAQLAQLLLCLFQAGETLEIPGAGYLQKVQIAREGCVFLFDLRLPAGATLLPLTHRISVQREQSGQDKPMGKAMQLRGSYATIAGLDPAISALHCAVHSGLRRGEAGDAKAEVPIVEIAEIGCGNVRADAMGAAQDHFSPTIQGLHRRLP